MRIILLGPPGAGKGTIAGAISEKYHIVHISTGDIFRSNIRDNTPLGQEAKAYIDKGDLVPDELTIRMLADRLNQEDAKDGFLLDGFPRTTLQADALENLMVKSGHKLDVALNVMVGDEIILQRLAGRRVCPKCGATYNVFTQKSKVEGICDVCGTALIQRADDTEETIRRRLDTYQEKTAPLISYYEQTGILYTIDNTGTVEESLEKLESLLRK